MNYTPLEDAYKIHHVNSNTYSGTLKYSPTCIYCNNITSTPLMNDGGSFRRCDRCKKNFRATILNEAVTNFSYSTNHLKGTN
jgi:hypothetical protein